MNYTAGGIVQLCSFLNTLSNAPGLFVSALISDNAFMTQEIYNGSGCMGLIPHGFFAIPVLSGILVTTGKTKYSSPYTWKNSSEVLAMFNISIKHKFVRKMRIIRDLINH